MKVEAKLKVDVPGKKEVIELKSLSNLLNAHNFHPVIGDTIGAEVLDAIEKAALVKLNAERATELTCDSRQIDISTGMLSVTFTYS